MRSRVPLLGAALIAALSAPAAAYPADAYLDVEPGGDTFLRASTDAWVDVEDPGIATAEELPSGEVLVTGKAEGRTLLMIYAEGRFTVVGVRVARRGEKPNPTSAAELASAELLAQARKACPGLGEKDGQLTVAVTTGRCRAALLELFRTGAYAAKDLELTFDVPTLQAQLRDMSKALDACGLGGKVKLAYSGAGLRMEGSLTPAEHRRALWAVFRSSAGRVALEDRIQLAGAADAGAPAVETP